MRIIGKGEFPGCYTANVRTGAGMLWSSEEIGGGGNGGFQAINLVVRWGVSRVVLTGFDCIPGHWHDEHQAGLANPTELTIRGWMKAFDIAAPALANLGVEVINCTRETALKCFPRAKLEDVI